MPVLAFWNGATAEVFQMKKIFAIMAITIVAAGATMATASARSYRHHHHHHGWSFGFRGSNAELRGNNGNSAGGTNSLANRHNTSGPGSGAAGTR
jgi:hypothetical protein